MAIDRAKRAFLFGNLIDNYTPIWVKFAFSSGYRAYCGPTYDILCCGINIPYFLTNLNPKRLRQLDSVNVTSMGCSADFIVCACDDGKLLTIPLHQMDHFTVESTTIEHMNDINVTHISVSNEDVFLLVNIDSVESNEKYHLLPEYVPFYQPLDIVLAHIKNMPDDTTPHFLRIDQTFASLQL